jgi:ATP-binding cassette subfamily B protein/subfamily B ATP-binding cassette protein MsbA
VLLIALGAGVGLLTPWPMKILVDSAIGHAPVSGLVKVVAGPFAERPMALLVFAVLAGLVLTVAQNAMSVLNNYVNTRLDQNIVLDFRTELFAHAERLSMSYHDRSHSGMLIYVINSQGDAVAKLVMAIPQLGQSVLTLLGMFWICFNMDRELALLSLSVVPFLYYSVGYYATHIQGRVMKVRIMEGESLSIIHEAVCMLKVIVAFGRERTELQRFRSQGETTVDARVRLTVRQTLFSLVVNTATAAGTAAVLGVGASHAVQGRVTVGQLLVVMSYIAAVYKPLEAISSTIGGLQEIFVSLQCAFDVLDTTPEIQDLPGARRIDNVGGKVTIEHVNFSYEGRQDTLRDIHFEADAGQVVAIVGPTGAGKTSLISLLPRFYTATSGRILIDDHETSEFTLESLRSHISLVLQDPLLFSMTVAENIRYGRLDASMDEIVEAAKAANAHDFIMRLPQQYETELGERGAKLSTGERQRIAVARAFLKNAPILILDEPTSSIDSKTEAVILDALDRLMMGRTTFIIAHRLSTVRYSDMILVMNQGRICEQGSHQELMEQRGMYYQLHQMQTTQRKSRRERASEKEAAAAEMV